MKFDWMSDKYGGGKYCMLGHGFNMRATFPMIKNELYEGVVLGKSVGRFNTQEEAMEFCEKVATEVIEDLYQSCVVEKRDVLNVKGESE